MLRMRLKLLTATSLISIVVLYICFSTLLTSRIHESYLSCPRQSASQPAAAINVLTDAEIGLLMRSDCGVNMTSSLRLLARTMTSAPGLLARTNPYRAIEVVGAGGQLLDRVCQFNVLLEIVRRNVWNDRGGLEQPWIFNSASGSVSSAQDEIDEVSGNKEREIVYVGDDDFLVKLSLHAEITTVNLPWISTKFVRRPANSSKLLVLASNPGGYDVLDDSVNLHISEYYHWVGSDPLCSWIETGRPRNNLKYDVIFPTGSCIRNYTANWRQPIGQTYSYLCMWYAVDSNYYCISLI